MGSSVIAQRENDFHILKSNDNLMIGGYASIEIVDKQNDLITLNALKKAVTQFMENAKFRNVMTNHSNVQVGEVVQDYRDKNGKLWKTAVDDVGFFVVIKLRDDIEKAKEINRGIRKGTLRSFSIGGQALQKVKKQHSELGEYSEISKLELHEVTICEKGINPEARFDILKQEKEGEQMTDKLEKALEELDTLLEEVNTLRKEEEAPAEEEMEYMDAPAEEEEEELDTEMKAQPDLGAGVLETGEPTDRVVIDNGNPVHDGQASKTVVKAFNNAEIASLNLSPANIEKAYVQYKEEQLEKLALDNLAKTFQSRLDEETSSRETIIAKSEYDAQSEVSALKEELSELRKSFSTDKTTILKAQEDAQAMPEGFPTSMDEIAKMDWSELHRFVGQ
jgi:HK97 family phage prohead protease